MKTTTTQQQQRRYVMSAIGTHQLFSYHKLLGASLAAFICTAIAVQGATRTWDGSENTLWNVGANWTDNTAPGLNDLLVFSATGAGTLNNDIVDLKLGTAGSASTAISFTLSGVYTLTGNQIGFSSTGNQTILHNAGATTQTIQNNIDTSGVNALLFQATDASGILNINGTISGSKQIQKNGIGVVVFGNVANSYLGLTLLNSGTLVVSKLANGGVNSSIGASTSSAGNLALAGGVLKYVGTGDSTDRLMNLRASSTTGIDSSGSGALKFTNTGVFTYTGPGVRTLNLSGTNTGDNTIAASGLADVGADKTSLKKSGAGTWILSGAHTYTGTTTVEEGTLLLHGNHSAATGDITVASGGRFGGDGTVGSDVIFQDGAKLVFDPAWTLTLTAGNTLSFDAEFTPLMLVQADGAAIDWGSLALDTYMLVDGAGTIDFTNISTAEFRVGGRRIYFQEGSLQLVVIPEPGTIALLMFGILAYIGVRRSRR